MRRGTPGAAKSNPKRGRCAYLGNGDPRWRSRLDLRRLHRDGFSKLMMADLVKEGQEEPHRSSTPSSFRRPTLQWKTAESPGSNGSLSGPAAHANRGTNASSRITASPDLSMHLCSAPGCVLRRGISGRTPGFSTSDGQGQNERSDQRTHSIHPCHTGSCSLQDHILRACRERQHWR